MVVPRPERPVRGSTSGRPIMTVLDVLGRRGALRVIWELSSRGQMTFRALQDASATNPGLLNARLKELRSMAIVGHADGGYFLTEQGQSLAKSLRPLSRWADSWDPGSSERPDHSS